MRLQFEAGAGANVMQLQSSVAPTVRVAYLVPSNRTAQPNAVANIQYALPAMQEWYREAFARDGLSERTFLYETEADGVTPKVHVVPISTTDAALRADSWGATLNAATAAGVPLYAPNQVWLLVPELHQMQPNGNILGGVALGASNGSAGDGGVALVSSDMLPSLAPGRLTDDRSYHGQVVAELGQYPLAIGTSFDFSDGDSFSSVASVHYGAVVHELTHAFGIPHDFRNDDNADGNLMGNGFRGFRGSLLPSLYYGPYSHVMWGQALVLHNNPYFTNDGFPRPGTPSLTWTVGNPVGGQVPITFTAGSTQGLGSIILQYDGNQVGEMDLEGTSFTGTFKTPYFTAGQQHEYALMVYDRYGNRTRQTRLFTPPAASGGPGVVPKVQTSTGTVRVGEELELSAVQSTGLNQGNVNIDWDLNFDGVYDTPATRSLSWVVTFNEPGVRLIRGRFTTAAGVVVESAPVPVRVLPAEPVTEVIEGLVFNDDDGDSMSDPTDAGRAGVSVYVDRDHNGARDPSEPAAMSSADGRYAIPGIRAGVYLLRTEAVEGFGLSNPLSGGRSVTVYEGRTSSGNEFGLKDVVRPRALGGSFVRTGGVDRVVIDFDEDVSASLAAADLSLRETGSSLPVATNDMRVEFDSQTKRATFTFPGKPGGRLPAGTWQATLAAAGVTDRAGNGLAAALTFPFTVNADVAGRYVFYHNSAFDGGEPGAIEQDDAAIATDKRALLAGAGPGTAANVTSFDKGINGVLIDLGSLPAGREPTAADFGFRVGNGGDPANWAGSQQPIGVIVRRGAGASASDRVVLIWADGSVVNTWLEVTVKATENTGLAVPDRFYFGNLVGDAGDARAGATAAAVNAMDYTLARRAAGHAGVSVTSAFDINRDGAVDAADVVLTRGNLGRRLGLNVAAAGDSVIAPAAAPRPARRPARMADALLNP